MMSMKWIVKEISYNESLMFVWSCVVEKTEADVELLSVKFNVKEWSYTSRKLENSYEAALWKLVQKDWV